MNNCNSNLGREKQIKGSLEEIPPRKAINGRVKPRVLEKSASELPWR